ncbi:MAG: hypothetical protein K6E91_10895 [Butyrivibrio sp.]|nr:hypothetical protein [Butyrivibrio sp.]
MSQPKRYNYRLIAAGALTIFYVIFTIVAFVSTRSWHYNAMTERPSIGLRSVYLSEIPLHQSFTAKRLAGARLWIFADRAVDYGDVVVTIGNEDTGEIYVSGEISGDNIKNVAESKPIDFAMNKEQGMIEAADMYFIELSTRGIGERNFRTLLSADEGIEVLRDGDEEALAGKMLCFVPLCVSVSDAFVYWIPVTCVYCTIMLLIFSRRMGRKPADDVQIPSGRNLIIAGAFALVSLVIGIVSAVNIASIEIIDNKSEELAEGFKLYQHSSYVEEFVMPRDKLKGIRVYLPDYYDNTALFVVSFQDEQGVELATKQSNEMELVGKGGYRLDVSDVKVEKGKVYDLFVFTGFIEDGEEVPVITRVEYEYAK